MGIRSTRSMLHNDLFSVKVKLILCLPVCVGLVSMVLMNALDRFRRSCPDSISWSRFWRNAMKIGFHTDALLN
jgi:hypothetical protein